MKIRTSIPFWLYLMALFYVSYLVIDDIRHGNWWGLIPLAVGFMIGIALSWGDEE